MIAVSMYIEDMITNKMTGKTYIKKKKKNTEIKKITVLTITKKK